MPPNPPSNAHGFAMRSMSLRDMQIPKSEKKILGPPPLLNPGDAPGMYTCNWVGVVGGWVCMGVLDGWLGRLVFLGVLVSARVVRWMGW